MSLSGLRLRAAEASLFAVSLLLSLAAVEAGLRLSYAVPDDMLGMRNDRTLRDTGRIPRLEYVPGSSYQQRFYRCSGQACRRDKVVDVRINSRGLRDVERPLKKPAGVVRALVLGDSFTFGYGLAPEETYPKRLEARLNALLPGGPRVDVINASADGYGTFDEASYLERDGLAYQPDLIVVGMYLNDALPVMMGRSDPVWDAWAAFCKRYPGEMTSNIQRNRVFRQPLYLARWASAALYVVKSELATKAWYRGLWSERNAAGMEQYREALDRIAELSRERALPVQVLLFPKLDWLDGRYPFDDIHALIASECAARGLPLMDLLPQLRGRDPATLWHHPSDHHPNAWTHDLAASALEKAIRESSAHRKALRLPP